MAPLAMPMLGGRAVSAGRSLGGSGSQGHGAMGGSVSSPRDATSPAARSPSASLSPHGSSSLMAVAAAAGSPRCQRRHLSVSGSTTPPLPSPRGPALSPLSNHTGQHLPGMHSAAHASKAPSPTSHLHHIAHRNSHPSSLDGYKCTGSDARATMPSLPHSASDNDRRAMQQQNSQHQAFALMEPPPGLPASPCTPAGRKRSPFLEGPRSASFAIGSSSLPNAPSTNGAVQVPVGGTGLNTTGGGGADSASSSSHSGSVFPHVGFVKSSSGNGRVTGAAAPLSSAGDEDSAGPGIGAARGGAGHGGADGNSSESPTFDGSSLRSRRLFKSGPIMQGAASVQQQLQSQQEWARQQEKLQQQQEQRPHQQRHPPTSPCGNAQPLLSPTNVGSGSFVHRLPPPPLPTLSPAPPPANSTATDTTPTATSSSSPPCAIAASQTNAAVAGNAAADGMMLLDRSQSEPNAPSSAPTLAAQRVRATNAMGEVLRVSISKGMQVHVSSPASQHAQESPRSDLWQQQQQQYTQWARMRSMNWSPSASRNPTVPTIPAGDSDGGTPSEV